MRRRDIDGLFVDWRAAVMRRRRRKRGTMRTPVSVKIKFKSPTVEHFIERYAADVSEGGIFIRTPKPLAVGTALSFEFQLQDGSPLLAGDGTVVWVREKDPSKASVSPGMGVRFEKLPPESRKVLNQVLEAKEREAEFTDDQPTRAALDPEKVLEDAEAAAQDLVTEAPEETNKAEDEAAKKAEADKVAKEAEAKKKAEEAARKEAARKEAEAKKAAEEAEAKKAAQEAEAKKAAQEAEAKKKAAEEARKEAEAKKAAKAEAAEESDNKSDESEDQRRDRLEKILFASQESIPEAEDTDVGSKPLSEEPKPTPTPVYEPAYDEKKSPMGVVVLLLLAAAAGAGIWYFVAGPGSKKKPVKKTPLTTKKAPPKAKQPTPAKKPVAPKVTVAMKLESKPAGAKILLDGKDSGKKTPATIEGLDPQKEYEFAFDLPGKKRLKLRQKPTPKIPLSVKLTIKAKRTVRFETTPPGASVKIDGRSLGKSPYDYAGKLRKGRRYNLSLWMKGYKTFNTKFSSKTAKWVRSGDDEIYKISVELQPDGTAKPTVAPTPKAKPVPRVRRPRKPRKPRKPKPAVKKPAVKKPAVKKPAAKKPAAKKPAAKKPPVKKPAAKKPAAKKAPAKKPPAKKGGIKAPSWSE
jgi:uncharacterized protein (TIGR02266 family)